ncbi:hypothetical protein LPJ53_005531 [Coemansia erecta]|uniref:C-CAP/cofactor C-like domain-containing protein n=1 Tax=Coemansia erecta TaxID=147472 RepID=A0A9W7XVI5_9FUNG|nr:hypothetical protein LPJ53_005531 [Coemansia erecta]
MASAGSAANAEAASKFWSYFQHQKESIKAMYADNQDISQSVRELDIKLREAFIYLPSYDQKQFTRDLDELRALLHRKGSNTSSATSATGSSGIKSKAGFRFKSAVSRPGSALQKPAEVPATPTESKTAEHATDTSTSFGFAGVNEHWVTADPQDQVAGTQTDCELRDIRNSVIDLRPISSSIRALNCHRIENTLIICGPFAGSATVRDSKNCTLVLGVRQFRMENSTDIDVFVHCASHPIIERSLGVRFAPYPSVLRSSDTAAAAEFEASGLGALPNMYESVDDFNWLRRQASPNWSIYKHNGDDESERTKWEPIINSSKLREVSLQKLLPQNQERPARVHETA